MFTSARFQLDVLSCVSGDVKYERMELTTSVLCWAGSSLEFLRANWPLRCGEFDQTAFRDVIGEDTRATDVARDDETKSSLSMFAGMWVGVGEATPHRPWGVHHLWICMEKPIIGPASSSRWTVNLRLTVSWAAVTARREVNERHVMGQRGQ